MAKPLRIASVNVNGIRASFTKGMREWLAERHVDILAMQEVRATTEIVQDLLGPEWEDSAARCRGRQARRRSTMRSRGSLGRSG